MLTKIKIIGTYYFLISIGIYMVDWIISLNISQTFTSILSFSACLFKFPKDGIDLFIIYFGLDHYILPITLLLFLKTSYDLIWGEGLEF